MEIFSDFSALMLIGYNNMHKPRRAMFRINTVISVEKWLAQLG